MRQPKSIGQAFLIASVVPSLLIVLKSLIEDDPDLLMTIGLMPVVYFFTLLFSISMGEPLFLLGRRFGLIRWWSVLIAGTLIGIAVAIFIRMPNLARIDDFMLICPIAVISALVFWWLAAGQFNARKPEDGAD